MPETYLDGNKLQDSNRNSSYFAGGSRDTFGKRVLDIVISSFLLILLAPLFALIALAVKLTSIGPVIYRQTRVGKESRFFQMLKFRTMVYNADQIGSWSTQNDDPRITRVGKMLRFSSLDELPQLVNVLRGKMSLVGPRPSVPNQINDYTEEQLRIILSVKPGISGLAQVSGRSTLSQEQQIAYSLDYALHRTLVMDLKILLKTVWVVVAREGVN